MASLCHIAKSAKAIKSLSTKQKGPAQVAIQYVLQNPSVTSAVVGIRTLRQLEDAVQAIDIEGLSDEEIRILRESLPVNFYIQHR